MLFVELVFKLNASVEAWVCCIKILGIQAILGKTKGIAEALIVNYLTFAEKFERLTHIGIVYHAQKIVIGNTRLLLC